jgi:TP901 family phage tail tape measure protein
MSSNRQINIYVNSGDAVKAVDKLTSSNDKLKTSITKNEAELTKMAKKLDEFKGDKRSAEFKKMQTAIEGKTKAIERDTEHMRVNTDEMGRLDRKIKGELSPSYNNLRNSVYKLTNELRNMSQQDAGFDDKIKDLKRANTEMQQFEQKIKNSEAAYKGMGASIKSVAIGSFIANAAGNAIGSFSQNVGEIKDAALVREQNRRQLQAITGVADSELSILDNYAEKLSRIELEGGKTFHTATNDIYEAFKLVGSAKPELLKNIPALQEVTKEVLILAKASGLDLPEATKAVTSILNQFGQSSAGAGKLINILAAGAKEGAKEIPFLTEAMQKVGPIANTSNMSIAQTISALEILGLTMESPEKAGTGLRGTLIQLQAEGFGKTKDGIFDFNLALAQLDKQYSSSASEVDGFNKVVKIVGTENTTAAIQLFKNRKEVERMTASIQGSNQAYSQAATNTILLDEAQKEFKKRVADLYVWVGQKLTPAFIYAYQSGSNLLNFFKEIPKHISNYKDSLTVLIAVMIAYNRQMIIARLEAIKLVAQYYYLVAVDKIQAVTLGIKTFAQKAYNIAIGQGTIATKSAALATLSLEAAMGAALWPILAIIAAIYAAKKGIDYYNDSLEVSQKMAKNDAVFKTTLTKNLKENEKAYQNLNSEIANFNQLSKKEQELIENKIKLNKIAIAQQLLDAKKKQKEAGDLAYEKEFNTVGGKVAGAIGLGYGNYLDGEKARKEAMAAKEEGLNSLREQFTQSVELENQLTQVKKRNLAESNNVSVPGGGAKDDKAKKALEDKLKYEAELQKKIKEIRHEQEMALQSDDARALDAVAKKYDAMEAEMKEHFKGDIDRIAKYKADIDKLEGTETSTLKQSQAYAISLKLAEDTIEKEKQYKAEQFAAGVLSQDEYNKELEKLDVLLLQSKINIADQYKDKVQKAGEDEVAFKKQLHSQEIQDLIKKHQDELKLIEEAKKLKQRTEDFNLNTKSKSAHKTVSIDDDRDVELEKIKLKYDRERELAKENADLLIQINREEKDAIADVEQSHADKVKAIREQLIQQAVSTAQNLIQGFTQIMGNNSEVELRRESKANDAKKKKYKEMLDSKKISQKKYDELVLKADEETAKKQGAIKKKQFQAEQMAKLLEIGINTAVAVAKAIAASPATFGMPFSGFAAAQGIIQAAVVASTPTPEFADGDIVTMGNRHSDGGIGMWDEKRGKRIGEMEVGELILSRKFVESNPDMIDPLLSASKSGTRLSDSLAIFNTPIPRVNTERIVDAVRYERGGVLPTPTQSNAIQSVTKVRDNVVNNENIGWKVLAEKFDNLQKSVDAIKDKEVVIDYDMIGKRNQEWAKKVGNKVG